MYMKNYQVFLDNCYYVPGTLSTLKGSPPDEINSPLMWLAEEPSLVILTESVRAQVLVAKYTSQMSRDATSITIINQYTIRRMWTEFVLVAYVNLLSLVLHKRGNSFLDLSQFVLLCMFNLHYLLTSLLVAHICTQSVESNVLVCVPASHWDILTWECVHVSCVFTRAEIRALTKWTIVRL